MKGENIDISIVDSRLVRALVDCAKELQKRPVCISFYGESASGKTFTSNAFVHALRQEGMNVVFLQMDDYYKLPPRENQAARAKDITQVGPQEVNIDQLDAHIKAIQDGATSLACPLVDFIESTITQTTLEIKQPVDFIIVEGTFLYLLENDDIKIFINRTYKDTHLDRQLRGREPESDLNIRTLEIEHQIIKKQTAQADFVIDKDFKFKPNPEKKENS